MNWFLWTLLPIWALIIVAIVLHHYAGDAFGFAIGLVIAAANVLGCIEGYLQARREGQGR